MLYILGAIGLVLIITVMIVIIIKKGNKEFGTKLTLKERVELEKMLEKKTKEQAQVLVEEKKEKEEKSNREIVPTAKHIYPSKDIKIEISRFATHIDMNNLKVQLSIRNGVVNFLNLDYKVALEEFSLATELNPQDFHGFYCRGLTKLELKNFESAISDFTECINLKMKDPNAFYYRALAYLYMRDIDHAILNFKSYISAESGYPEAYVDLAGCFKQIEKFDEAIKYFSIAIEKNPKDQLSYFERGLLKQKVNDNEGGCADLKIALKMGYIEASQYVNDLCKDKIQ